MNIPNANDPLEKLLRDQPLDQAPAGVYERLQAKAAWNKPSAPRWPIFLGILTALAMLAFALFMPLPHPRPEPAMPEPAAPIIVPASAPIIALAKPSQTPNLDDDLSNEIGGFSARWMTNEPPFAVNFGSECDRSSSQREGLGS